MNSRPKAGKSQPEAVAQDPKTPRAEGETEDDDVAKIEQETQVGLLEVGSTSEVVDNSISLASLSRVWS